MSDTPSARCRRRSTAAGALTIAALAGMAALPVAAQTPFEWSGTMSGDRSLEVTAISGDVRAVLASGATARVIAHKRGDPDDFGEVEVRAVEENDRVVVCVIYGSWNFDREGCSGDWHDDDRRDRDRRRDNIRVSVDFEVQVPARVAFRGSSVSGDVEIDALRSDVRASSVSGDVRVVSTGVVRASSVSGELDIEMGSLDWDDLSFSTVSGDITLRMPASLAADVRFHSVSGDFRSDFPLTMEDRDRGRYVGLDVSGVIGAGGRSLSVRTVSGDVDLRRGR